MTNTWITFLRKNGGKGYTREELQMMYKGVKRSPKKDCQLQVQDKIRKNMDEYDAGRFVSRQQAIAVSYSQVLRKSPQCKRYLKRSPKK